MKVQFLWHSFFRVDFSGATVLLDPFMNMPLAGENFMDVPSGENTFKLRMKCPVSLKDLKGIDFICVSNEQFDHFDRRLVESIAKNDNAVVVGHESVLNELNIPANLKHNVMVGSRFNLRGVDVQALDAHFPSSFYPLSFLLSKNNESIYFAGNTALMDSFSEIKADVALLPIGGNTTMDVIDAVRATKTMKPKYAIPMHYNSFDSIVADPEEFRARIEKSILKTVPIILKPNQVFKT